MFTIIHDSHDFNAPLKQQFINSWVKTIDFAVTNPTEYAFMNIYMHSPRISEEASKKVNELMLPIIEIFDKGKREGIIKDDDTMQLIIFTTGAISASIIRIMIKTKKKYRFRMSTILSTLVNFISPEVIANASHHPANPLLFHLVFY